MPAVLLVWFLRWSRREKSKRTLHSCSTGTALATNATINGQVRSSLPQSTLSLGDGVRCRKGRQAMAMRARIERVFVDCGEVPVNAWRANWNLNSLPRFACLFLCAPLELKRVTLLVSSSITTSTGMQTFLLRNGKCCHTLISSFSSPSASVSLTMALSTIMASRSRQCAWVGGGDADGSDLMLMLLLLFSLASCERQIRVAQCEFQRLFSQTRRSHFVHFKKSKRNGSLWPFTSELHCDWRASTNNSTLCLARNAHSAGMGKRRDVSRQEDTWRQLWHRSFTGAVTNGAFILFVNAFARQSAATCSHSLYVSSQ